MKEKLSQIEAQLQQFVEKNATRLFGSQDAEARLVSELIQAMQEQIRSSDTGTLTAPNIFSLNVHYLFAQDIRSNQALLDSLAQRLMESVEEIGIHFEAQISINVFPDENLEEGEFSVRAMWKEQNLAETQAMEEKVDTSPLASVPQKAFLIVGGSKIFTLEEDIVNIGRKLDNHLVIDDPRISRKHGQLRAIKGRYMLFDLESSGGTFVNGERINQAILHPGDVISLAGVPMVYGQDAVRAISDTQEYKTPDISVDDSTTTTVRLEDLDLDTFDD
jgi:hypothetical protein